MAFAEGSTHDSTNCIIDTNLLRKIDKMPVNDLFRVIIKMRERAKISESDSLEMVESTIDEKTHGGNVKGKLDAGQARAAVRAAAVQHWKATAESAQKPVHEYLTQKIRASHLPRYQSFWLVNLVFAELTKEQILDLAKLPEVEAIFEDIKIQVSPIERVELELPVWDHIGFVKAPEVWAVGYRGQKIKVAVLDTGVDISHPELAHAMGGETPDHRGYWAEFDADGNLVEGSRPHDSDTHGTHVSGTVAGRNVNMRIGMAPEVVLGHALILPGGSGSMPQVLAGMQWAIEEGFDVVNGSWGVSDKVPELLEAVNNLVAAGIVPVFAIGNSGRGQADAPGNTPHATAVGAVDETGRVADFSGGGLVEYPEYTYTTEEEKIKPDIAAPGVAVTSAVPGGEYAAYNGTSMATPHVAGGVALLLSKNPDLSVAEVQQILLTSVGGFVGLLDDPGEFAKDTRYGWGILNVLQAIELIPEPTMTGQIMGYVEGEAEFVCDAELHFVGPVNKSLTTDHHGYYQGTLLAGEYSVVIQAKAYQAQGGSIEVLDEEVTISNYQLELAPLGYIEGDVTDVDTHEVLADVRVEVVDKSIQSVTNEAGEFGVAVREGQYDLRFTANGYYPEIIRHINVLPGETTKIHSDLRFGYQTFAGQVVNQADQPVGRVFVAVQETEEIAFSDDTGHFLLNLPEGVFTVVVNQIGFYPEMTQVQIVHGEITGKIIKLSDRPHTILFENHFDGTDEWADWEAIGGWHHTRRSYLTTPFSAWHGDETTGRYTNNQHAKLTARNLLTIPEAGKTFLTFRFWGEAERGYDFFYVAGVFDGERKVIYEYTGENETWTHIDVELTEYAGKEMQLIFEFSSDFSIAYTGVFLDDVYVWNAVE